MSADPRPFDFSKFIPNNSNAVARMSTKSAMSPLLWAVGIMMPILATTAYVMPAPASMIFVYLIVALVAFVLLAFAFFALTNPDRLQSEEFRAEMTKITLLGQSGKEPPTIDLSAEQVPNAYAESEKAGQIDER